MVYDLVTHVFTDDNGEFVLSKLPADTYRINFQYPGYPMDTLSQIDIVLGEDPKTNSSSVEALVIDGQITVRQLVILGFDDGPITFRPYPNPASEVLNIDWESNDNEIQVQIYNESGGLVNDVKLTKENNKIDVRFLPNGFYFIKVNSQTNKVKGTFRIIISDK